MSSFSDNNFVKKLGELNNTQQSIQTLSLWLIHHRKHSKTIVQVWLREMQKVRPSQRLTFMYLANDVIQNSKKKGPEFTRDFATVLPEAYKISTKDADDKIKKSVDRILGIWEERAVYSKHFIDQIRLSKPGVQNTEKTTPPAKRKKMDEMPSLREEIEAMPKDENPVVPDAEELVKRLADLEHSASSDAAVREKIAALPPDVSDINHLSKITDKETAVKLFRQVEDACILLSEYNFRLNAELEERKQVGKMLRDFLTSQKDQVVKGEEKLQESKQRLEKVGAVRQELMSHIRNLPDLSKLPDIDGGLAPLPSAGDLFSL
ncbi:regulation of nuclear pre-mRNA domain-containing protein 1B-like isoform X2 [Saccostrea echinata]|uniref:regulation of nuclear pre-mRNA domain-containing protein 1B-like isoform X2 n=1 Tax=Saccostrea echinata TaxID=191078 RepID=UPI002A826087|nr:regulation of nuclear pre-mRNA domain-containing protein 1B-like isoform X2 [Saccostrea echinata]